MIPSIRLAPVALLALAACAAERPNLLLISVDTLRPDHVGVYGYHRDTSPELDRLAEEGVLWENAYSTAPATVASHASLFTGRFPYQHGALNFSTPLAEPEETLAETLSREGYRTFAVATSVRFHAWSGFSQGFESYETLYELPKNARSRAATDRILEQVAAGDDRPFFAFLHYFGPHAPYWPPARFRRRWHRGRPLPLPGGPASYVHLNRHPGMEVPPRIVEYLVALYDAEILFLDGELGRLLRGLDELEVGDNTLVVLVSDHGEEFKEHDGLAHARTLYEEALRIPLILRWRGVLPAGQRVERPAQLVDVMPTVLELLGLPVPPELPGRSLAADLRGRPVGDGPDTADDRILGQRGRGQWSVTATIPEGRFKLVHEGGGKSELYDLERDPGEQVDLWSRRVDVQERLLGLVPEGLARGARAGASVEVSEEVKRRLVAIGYADEVAAEETQSGSEAAEPEEGRQAPGPEEAP